jgi:putative chitinase
MKTLSNLGTVGDALRDKIKEQKKKLSPEELASLADKGYAPRGTGFVNTATNKFVSNKEIDAALGDRSKPATKVLPEASGDPVYDVVKSIEGSINDFVELITGEGPDAEAIPPTVDGAKQEKKPKPPEVTEIPIFKKIKALAGILVGAVLQFAYPLYLKAKEMFEQIKLWVERSQILFEEKVLTFFTVDIPRYIEDIKDFFVVKVPSYFSQFIDMISVGIQNILDIPKEVLYAMEGFSVKFGRDVIDTISPWLSKIGIDLDDYSKELKSREEKINQKKETLDAAQAKREKEYQERSKGRESERMTLDATKETERQREDKLRQEEFDRRKKAVDNKQQALDQKQAPTGAAPVSAIDAKPAKTSANTGKAAMIAKLNENKITDPTARAAIMAQAGHESGGFTTLSENLRYSAKGLLNTFKKYFKTEDDAQTYAGLGPAAIADRVYGNRMGNAPEGSGDGFKYRGRGFIQLTGKDNYTKFGYGGNPDAVSSPDAAAETAIKYMLGYKGDWSNITAVTKFVNGGTIGLEDREKYFKEYLQDPSVTQVTAVAASPAPSSGGTGNQVAAATKNADIKPPIQQQTASTSTNKPQQVASNGSGGRSSPPSSDGINKQYHDHFALPA